MNPEDQTLLDLARELLANHRRGEAAACLKRIRDGKTLSLEAHNLMELHRLPGNFSEWIGVNASIHADDDIFRFFAGHPTSINPIRDYLSDGWRTMNELVWVLAKLKRNLNPNGRFLEFACGHGRFTRHLVNWVDPANIHVSDVVPGSVDFLKDSFGVQGFYSEKSPRDICWPADFDVVFVLSLFSHAPSGMWGDWLTQLWDATAKGGVLIISTHGEKAASVDGVDLAGDGFTYFQGSESSVLSPDIYGCAYASREFTTRRIGDVLPEARLTYIESHFWGRQDAIVLEK